MTDSIHARLLALVLFVAALGCEPLPENKKPAQAPPAPRKIEEAKPPASDKLPTASDDAESQLPSDLAAADGMVRVTFSPSYPQAKSVWQVVLAEDGKVTHKGLFFAKKAPVEATIEASSAKAIIAALQKELPADRLVRSVAKDCLPLSKSDAGTVFVELPGISSHRYILDFGCRADSPVQPILTQIKALDDDAKLSKVYEEPVVPEALETRKAQIKAMSQWMHARGLYSPTSARKR